MPDRAVPKVQAAGSQVGADQQFRGLTSAIATPGAELRDDLATLPAGTTLAAAQKACAAMPRCLGYTYHAACGPTVPGNVTIKLKGSLHSGGGADWCRVAKPPKLDGVFLENVETLTSAEWSA